MIDHITDNRKKGFALAMRQLRETIKEKRHITEGEITQKSTVR